MGRQPRILTDDLAGHPAVRLWMEMTEVEIPPAHVVVLRRKRTGAVYRLPGVAPDGRDVIAKRCDRDKGARERIVYEYVLPRLAAGPPACYGVRESTDDGSVWLFLEDVGGERYDPDIASHRTLAARWLGRFQASVERDEVTGVFPERGAPFYRDCLDAMTRELATWRGEDPGRSGRATLDRLAAAADRAWSRWEEIEALCGKAPTVLTHGDCLGKNVHFRDDGRAAPFDWGGAGWGPAGTDLGLLALPHRGPPDDRPDCAAYHDAIRERWPRFAADAVPRLAAIGQLFWGLKVVSRVLPELRVHWRTTEDVFADLEIYARAMERSLSLPPAPRLPAAAPRRNGSGPAARDDDAADPLSSWLERVVAERFPRFDAVRRSPLPPIGSYDCTRVTVELAGGGRRSLFLKDYSRSRQSKDEADRRQIRELVVYRDLLDGARLGTPNLYGLSLEDPPGRFLLLESVDADVVREIDVERGTRAVAWLARMQRVFLDRPDRLDGCDALIDHDAGYFRDKADAARRDVRALAPDAAERLERVLEGYARHVAWMVGPTRSLVHGGFIPWHILVDDRVDPARVCVVDWELAARGSTLYDLAIFVDDAEEPVRERLCRAYRDAAARTGVPVPDPAELRHAVTCLRLHRVVDWLSRSVERGFPPRKVARLVARAESLDVR